jgi:hypothetical protein
MECPAIPFPWFTAGSWAVEGGWTVSSRQASGSKRPVEASLVSYLTIPCSSIRHLKTLSSLYMRT